MTPKKYFYFAVTSEENGKFYSYIMKIAASDNVKSRLSDPKIKTATACSTKKNAAFLVNLWNATYKANNAFLFDSPSF